ncbi:MAG: hypothetical protein R2707_05280 [Acidimicrobiales bacterium]
MGSLLVGDAIFSFLAEGRIPPWLVESHDRNRVVADACGPEGGRFCASRIDPRPVVETRRTDGAVRVVR